MLESLSFDLHALVARLDRSADRILRAELGVSYRRFLALFMIRELGVSTQRELAERLEVSEPAISRMTTVLADGGLLIVESTPGGGNRRQLRLTSAGDKLVGASRELLGRRFKTLVEQSGIPAAAYARHTRRLLDALGDTVQRTAIGAEPVGGTR
jgi:DNA-binding MarR family transcriptional regulator